MSTYSGKASRCLQRSVQGLPVLAVSKGMQGHEIRVARVSCTGALPIALCLTQLEVPTCVAVCAVLCSHHCERAYLCGQDLGAPDHREQVTSSHSQEPLLESMHPSQAYRRSDVHYTRYRRHAHHVSVHRCVYRIIAYTLTHTPGCLRHWLCLQLDAGRGAAFSSRCAQSGELLWPGWAPPAPAAHVGPGMLTAWAICAAYLYGLPMALLPPLPLPLLSCAAAPPPFCHACPMS